MSLKHYIKKQIEEMHEVAYERNKVGAYARYLPVDTYGDKFTEVVHITSTEGTGEAGKISLEGNSMPMANIEGKEKQKFVHHIGIGYSLNTLEIERARNAGRNIRRDKATSALNIYEKYLTDVVVSGKDGFKGIANQSNADISKMATSVPNPSTSEEWLKWINEVLKNGKDVDTILFPDAEFVNLSSSFVGESKTLVNFLAENNILTNQTGKKISIMSSGADAGRFAYKKDMDVVCLALPRPHEFGEVWKTGHNTWEVPGYFATAGVIVKDKSRFFKVDS